jgi:Fe-S-cluster containining protein
MFLDRVLGRGQKTRFECVFEECKSLCCKNNIVALNEDDVAAFQEMNIDTDDVTLPLNLNEFLEILGTSPIKQLEGLFVLQLKKDEKGNCMFLSPEDGRCKIYNQRPYYCREFPFKFARGKIKSTDPICPGLGREDEKDMGELKKNLGLEGVQLKPPYLVGDEDKLKTARTLMSTVFRLMK